MWCLELSAMDRQEKRTIRKLESELPKWQALVDGSSVPEFDSQTLAILKGRLVRYLMRSQEVPNVTLSLSLSLSASIICLSTLSMDNM
jgi:hypothetical protein